MHYIKHGSSSVRGCGLKLVLVHVPVIYHQISLCVRMWIEISVSVISSALFDVILYARVWIEIFSWWIDQDTGYPSSSV